MKRKTILSICAVVVLQFFIYCACKAQSISNASHYSKSQLEFMMRNGFDPTQPNWRYIYEVDSLLYEAVQLKQRANRESGFGFGAFAAISGWAFLESLSSSSSSSTSPGNKENKINGIFYAGAGLLIAFVAMSEIKRNKAKERVRSAAHLYKNYQFNKPGTSYEDFFLKEKGI